MTNLNIESGKWVAMNAEQMAIIKEITESEKLSAEANSIFSELVIQSLNITQVELDLQNRSVCELPNEVLSDIVKQMIVDIAKETEDDFENSKHKKMGLAVMLLVGRNLNKAQVKAQLKQIDYLMDVIDLDPLEKYKGIKGLEKRLVSLLPSSEYVCGEARKHGCLIA